MARTKLPFVVRTLSYGKTFNNGNYEASRIDVTVDVNEGEDAGDAMGILMDEVDHLRKMELS